MEEVRVVQWTHQVRVCRLPISSSTGIPKAPVG